MILILIGSIEDSEMLQRTLGSGWGVLIPGLLLGLLGFTGLSMDMWRGIVVCGMLLTCVMIWHHRLRHFVLLPSALALVGGAELIVMNLRLLG